MPINVSEELFNAIVKASKSEKKAGFDHAGLWVDWDLNNGLLKGNFSIPIEKSIDSKNAGCKIVVQDFLNYAES